MRIVQALQWLKDTLPTDRGRIVAHLSTLLADGRHGRDLRNDLRAGFATLPAWMQDILRELVGPLAVRPATSIAVDKLSPSPEHGRVRHGRRESARDECGVPPGNRSEGR
jgi:hypothetical protein